MTDPQGWQPIETAPRDGSVIDLWAARDSAVLGSQERRFPDAWWSCEPWGGPWKDKPRWVVEVEYHEIPVEIDGWRATNWMPLPPSPSGE
jgi:hypothetical protein